MYSQHANYAICNMRIFFFLIKNPSLLKTAAVVNSFSHLSCQVKHCCTVCFPNFEKKCALQSIFSVILLCLHATTSEYLEDISQHDWRVYDLHQYDCPHPPLHTYRQLYFFLFLCFFQAHYMRMQRGREKMERLRRTEEQNQVWF